MSNLAQKFDKVSIVDSIQDHISTVEIFLETAHRRSHDSSRATHSLSNLARAVTVEQSKFGWGKFSPGFFKCLLSIEFFLFATCCFVTCQGMVVSGFISVSLSTIEKRFRISSTGSGFVAMGYDLASIICLVPVSFYGGLGHKPRWIATGALVMGVGSITFAMPHFLTGTYLYDSNEESTLICQNETEDNKEESRNSVEKLKSFDKICKYSQAPSAAFIYILLMGNMLHGAGSTPLFTLAVAYLDENLERKKSPIYFSIYYSTAMIGPALGYILGGRFLKTHIDIGRIDTNKLTVTPDDPRWLGAWWIGFLITGILFIVFSIILYGFPPEMPNKYKIDEEKELEKLGQTGPESVELSITNSSDIFVALKILATNLTFIFITLSGCLEGALVSGFVLFSPKFVEATFNLTASWAGQLIGLATIPSGSLGIVLGGYLVKKFHMSAKSSLKFSLAFLGGALLLTLVMLIQCSDVNYVGINYPYLDQEEDINFYTNGKRKLTSDCNVNCNCSEDVLSPVCGLDGLTYVSPCLAGCSSSFQIKYPNETIQTYFKHCACIENRLEYNRVMSNKTYSIINDTTAVDGTCKHKCNFMPFFMTLYSLTIFVAFICWTPILTATLRCVAEEHKSVALGFQWMIVRTIGMIPAPMIFGSVVDRACLFWSKDKCSGIIGSCALYTSKKMGVYFLSIALTFKSLSFVFILLAVIFLKKVIV